MKKNARINRIVLTGGPGAGKSTLIQALMERGFICNTESGREIIQAQITIEGFGLPWKNPQLYAELMLAREMGLYRQSRPAGALIFHDRAIPDILGYLETINEPIPRHLRLAIDRYRYHPQVFILPPWPDIYVQDNERKQSFDEAVATCETMVRVYANAGYQLQKVPWGSVAQRLTYILTTLEQMEG